MEPTLPARTLAPLIALLLALLALMPAPARAGKPYCGDGLVNKSEQCDKTSLGGQSCASLGYYGGTLACTSACTFNTAGCTTAPPPPPPEVCGDGVVSGYEECDGAADGACPGSCSDHCACPSLAPGDLEIHVIDVGQGDAVLVVSPDGFTMLVDAGTGGQDATIDAYLASIGAPELDYTVVTHMEADHVGGMDGVLAAHPEVGVCFDHGGTYTTLQYSEYDAAADGRREALAAGEPIDLGPSMTVEVLHAHTGSANDNLNSVVLLLTYGDFNALIGGDCEEACEATFDPGAVEIYKVHHHGASDASSQAFLEQMDPWTALISVGASNPYGHPTAETLDRLTAIGADIYRTDLSGDLVVVSTGLAYTVNDLPVCSAGETRACGETDVGACSLGEHPCSGGAWGACEGAVYPGVEACDNGLDDDCDGMTDSGDDDCVSSSAWVVLAQVSYDTPGTDSVEEFIDLYNAGATAVAIGGWKISDNAGTWTIPAGATIGAGSYLTLARNASGFLALYGHSPDVAGLSLDLNNTGDLLVLADEVGVEVDRVAWEGYLPGWTIAASIGNSIERTDPSVDTDAAGDWSITSPASPRP